MLAYQPFFSLLQTKGHSTYNDKVGINLGDSIFRGIYHGKRAHEDDLEGVLQRAVDAGCIKLMVTGSDLMESKKAVRIAKEHRESILCSASPRSCSMTRR